MKLILFIASLFCIKIVSGQNSYDSLAKYSYPIVCLGDNENGKGNAVFGTGTGFFIRHDNKVSFVTNYHVYTGYEFESCRVIIPVKVIGVYINNRPVFLPSKRDTIYEKKICNVNAPDLIVLDFDTTKIRPTDVIYDISTFIDKTTFALNPENGICYGFHLDKKSPTLKIDPQNTSGNYRNVVFDKKGNPSNLFYEKGELIYRSSYGFAIYSGMSGAPVFGEYRLSNGQTVIKFLGVAALGFGDKTASMVREGFVMDNLKAHSN